MLNSQMTGALTQTWVTVTDSSGRMRLEAHWVDPTLDVRSAAPIQTPHAA